MLPTITDVVWSVCFSVTSASSAKTAEPIEMSFAAWTLEARNYVLDGNPDPVDSCPQSILSILFDRVQQRCGLWLPVWCSNLLLLGRIGICFHVQCKLTT